MTFTAFDYVMMAVVFISVVISIWRGLVREVMSLLSWIAAIFLAIHYTVPFADWMPSVITSPSARYVTAFILIFVGAVFLLELFGVLLAKLTHAAGLAFIDRVLGAIFGAARGVLLAWIAVLLAGLTGIPQEPWWKESMLAASLENSVLAARPLLPVEVAKRLKYS